MSPTGLLCKVVHTPTGNTNLQEHTMKTTETAHDVFWLARHAHNVLAPLIEEAQEFEPSIRFHIEMGFGRNDVSWTNGFEVNIAAYWSREYPIMFIQEFGLRSTEQVAKAAAKVQRFIDTERAAALEAIEAAEDAAFNDMLDREEQDRAEHDRDIYLQNVARGN